VKLEVAVLFRNIVSYEAFDAHHFYTLIRKWKWCVTKHRRNKLLNDFAKADKENVKIISARHFQWHSYQVPAATLAPLEEMRMTSVGCSDLYPLV